LSKYVCILAVVALSVEAAAKHGASSYLLPRAKADYRGNKTHSGGPIQGTQPTSLE